MTIPTVKGAITLPIKIRQKYDINQRTPLEIIDEGNGIIKVKVLKTKNYEDVILTETGKSIKLTFPKGIDPQELIKRIKELDG